MDRRKLQASMFEQTGASRPQRLVLAAFLALWIILAWWLLAGRGLGTLGNWLHQPWGAGNDLRCYALAVAFSIYFIRVFFTLFVFLRRGVSWNEVFTIAPWTLFIVLFLSIEGAASRHPPGAAALCGAALFAFGSWMNSAAEYARYRWKQRPEHRGQLYTGGWFRWSRHPNYLGDLLSFSGLCLISGAWITAVVPLLMLAGFVFVNIPVLDSHLHDHYGAAFDEYAQRTRRLVPFLY